MKRSAEKPRILIAEYTTSDIIREIPYLFQEAGCVVDIFCSKQSSLKKNMYWNTWLQSPNSHDQFSETLQTLAQNECYDLIILANDSTIRNMNETMHNERLARNILPIADLKNRYTLGSKAGLSVLCHRDGILTPDYMIYEGPSTIDRVPEHLFPLLIKLDRSEGGCGVIYCANRNELIEKIQNLQPEEKKDVVLQKYIPGENIAVEAFYKNGKLLGYTYSKVLATSEGEFSASITREYREYPEIEPSLIDIGKALSINGFSNMTFMQYKEQHYLIEADLRPNVWFRLAEFCGVDFSRAIQNYFSESDEIVRPAIPHTKSHIVIRHWSREINHHMRHREISGLWSWLTNKDNRWQFIPWYDPKVLWTMSMHLINTNVRRFIKRIIGYSYYQAHRKHQSSIRGNGILNA